MTPAQQRVVTALAEHGAMTVKQIAGRAHVSFWTLKNHYIGALVAAGRIHQSGWHFYGFGHVPVYSAGVGETPPRPVRHVDHSQHCKEWRERSGHTEAKKAERRLRRPPDRALAALLGLTG